VVRQRFAKPYRGNKPLRGFESRTLRHEPRRVHGRLKPDVISGTFFGGVREWFNRAVLKTVVLVKLGPWVRIPPPPLPRQSQSPNLLSTCPLQNSPAFSHSGSSGPNIVHKKDTRILEY
jgi:hypothetical protein